jgi:hypothetical protein
VFVADPVQTGAKLGAGAVIGASGLVAAVAGLFAAVTAILAGLSLAYYVAVFAVLTVVLLLAMAWADPRFLAFGVIALGALTMCILLAKRAGYLGDREAVVESEPVRCSKCDLILGAGDDTCPLCGAVRRPTTTSGN